MSGKSHCCEMMQSNVDKTCETHADPFDCPDQLVHYVDKFDEYGIIVHDGGRSCVRIAFCPWCGAKLPESKRERWFTELKKLGIDEPSDSDIPTKYETDAWYESIEPE